MTEERRIYKRRKIYVTCQVDCGDRVAAGRVTDASENGIAILLPEHGDLIKGETRIQIPPAHQPEGESFETIALRAQLVDLQKKTKGHRLGLRIVQVESGASDWTQLYAEFKH